jgi:hypothetical protein
MKVFLAEQTSNDENQETSAALTAVNAGMPECQETVDPGTPAS